VAKVIPSGKPASAPTPGEQAVDLHASSVIQTCMNLTTALHHLNHASAIADQSKEIITSINALRKAIADWKGKTPHALEGIAGELLKTLQDSLQKVSAMLDKSLWDIAQHAETIDLSATAPEDYVPL
jgi:hypothetical protein